MRQTALHLLSYMCRHLLISKYQLLYSEQFYTPSKLNAALRDEDNRFKTW